MSGSMTYSRLMAWLECPQKEHFEYTAGGCGIRPKTPFIPFIEGEFGHYALYHFYRSGRMLKANLIKRTRAMIEENTPESGLEPEVADKLETSMNALIGACLGYAQVYRKHLEDVEVLGLEVKGSFTLAGTEIPFRIDRITKDKKTGKVTIWENKFVSDVSPDKYAVLPIDLQGLIYLEGARTILGKYPDFRAWDYIIKSRLRRSQAKGKAPETWEAFWERVRTQYVEEAGEKFFRPPVLPVDMRVLTEVQKRISALISMKGAVKPWMNFNSCLGKYNQKCPFSEACAEILRGHPEGWNHAACTGLYTRKVQEHEEMLDSPGMKEDWSKEAKEKE